MKRNLRGLVLTVVTFIFIQSFAFGQDLKPFEIIKPFGKSTYDGVKIKKIKAKRLKEIIMASNDTKAVRHFRAHKGWVIAQLVFTVTISPVPVVVCALVARSQFKKSIRRYNEVVSGGVTGRNHGDDQPVQGMK